MSRYKCIPFVKVLHITCNFSTGLADLLTVSSLRSLDLSECLRISGTEIVNGLTASNDSSAQLERLNLRSCTYIQVSVCVCVCAWVRVLKNRLIFLLLSLQDMAVFSLTQLLGNTLRELDLTSCVNVTDLSVCAIATYLQRLVVLRLGWCNAVTDWGLLGMVETTRCEAEEERVRGRIVQYLCFK